MNNSHKDYIIANRLKASQSDYLNLAQLLDTDIVVSPMEQITAQCGKKKSQRANKNSLLAYQDLTTEVKNTVLLLPVVLSSVDDFVNKVGQNVRQQMDGVMLCGGDDMIGLAS